VQINENSDNTAAFSRLLFPRKMIITPVWGTRRWPISSNISNNISSSNNSSSNISQQQHHAHQVHANKTTLSFLER
jgi:hypothetical protein